MSEPAKKQPTGPRPVEPADQPAPGAAPEPKPAPSARDLRRQRSRRLALRLAVGVGLPTILAAAYYVGMAAPQYESVTLFTIQSADSAGVPSLELFIASVPGSGATRDAMLARRYAESRDMLRTLVEEHGFVEHYAGEDVDIISRLSPDASTEEVFEYYQDKVDAEYDTQTSVVTIRVRAFSAEKAEELAAAILASSEAMVNRMMAQARQDRIQLASSEVQRAEERLGTARREILRLQGERAEFNPAASAESVLTVRGTLEAELAAARAELQAMRATLQPGTPQLAAQQQRVAALSRQVQEQTRRLAGGNAEGLSEDIAAFEPAMAEKEFAERAYASALTGLEMARLEASRQHRYLVTIARPSAPDEPTHPRLFVAILTVFVVSLLVLGIGSLLLASVREHANL